MVRDCRIRRARGRRPGLVKTLSAQPTGIAPATGVTIRTRIIAAAGKGVVQAQLHTLTDDPGLGKPDQGGVDLDCPASLGIYLGGQVGHALVGRDVLGPTIGIAGVVEGIDTDEDAARLQHLRPGQGKGQEDGIARRDIGDRDTCLCPIRTPILRHRQVTGEGRSTETAQVDVQNKVLGHI